MRRGILLLVTSLALGAGDARARQQVAPVPLPLDVVAVEPGAFVLQPDPARIAAFREHAALRTEPIALPDGSAVELDLVRVDVERLAPGIRFDGVQAERPLDALDLTLWTGSTRGERGASAFLALSRFGCRGWIDHGGERFHLLARPGSNGDWASGDSLLAADSRFAALGASRTQLCAAPLRTPAPSSRSQAAPRGGGPGVVLECKVAVEGDYQLFDRFDDVNAELAYVVALLGAVSSRYEGQLGVVLTYPYLNLWTVPGDPWSAPDNGGTSFDVLYEFRAAWAGNIPGGASLAHFLSGAPLGGGVAYLDVLCDSSYGFGVSGNLTEDGLTPFPVVQGPLNWDFVVVAHELGHNFSAIHTHEECPPLDQCAPPAYFGPCQSARVCTSQGTIMSYCHLCIGGLSNITTYFHAAQVAGMRAAAEGSCIPVYCRADVYVDSAFVGPGVGTPAQPFDTIVEGLAEVCDAGTLWIEAGTYDEPTPLAITQPVALKTLNGSVTIR